MEPMKADLSLAMIAHVQKTGQALSILNDISNNPIFDNLSKHNPFWDSSDEMDDLRMNLSCIQDKLADVLQMLTVDPYEGNL